jgi:hypothetical protein
LNKLIKYALIVLVVIILAAALITRCSKKPAAEKPAATAAVPQAPRPVTTAAKPEASAEKQKKSAQAARAKAPSGKVNLTDYEFKLSTDKTTFKVMKKGTVVMSRTAGDKESFQISADNAEKSLPKAGADLLGDGRPVVVLKTKSEKDSCSNVYSIFSVSEDMSLIAEIKGLEDGIEFKDIDHDNISEILGRDCTFLDWWAALGEPPAPKVILRYSPGSGYVLADDLMRKDPPSAAQLSAKAAACRNGAISKVWSYMLDLIYSGNGDAAMKFYDQLEWNPEWEAQNPGNDTDSGKSDKQEYLEAFKEHLSTSPYWPALKKMNNWEYSDMAM